MTAFIIFSSTVNWKKNQNANLFINMQISWWAFKYLWMWPVEFLFTPPTMSSSGQTMYVLAKPLQPPVSSEAMSGTWCRNKTRAEGKGCKLKTALINRISIFLKLTGEVLEVNQNQQRDAFVSDQLLIYSVLTCPLCLLGAEFGHSGSSGLRQGLVW